jgi:hypothetical protein
MSKPTSSLVYDMVLLFCCDQNEEEVMWPFKVRDSDQLKDMVRYSWEAPFRFSSVKFTSFDPAPTNYLPYMKFEKGEHCKQAIGRPPVNRR